MTQIPFKEVPPKGVEGQVGYVPEWQRVFANGFAPQLGIAGLAALQEALEKDDPTLIQGLTARPTIDGEYPDAPIEAACAIGFGGWKSLGFEHINEIEEFFGKACFDCDAIMGEPCSSRHFLNWFDDQPREKMIAELLPVVRKIRKTYAINEYQGGLNSQPKDQVAA